ncbi:hypothetical protein [Treponema sp. C6A8]|uniref:hypothetical protein n=1 Tax=Treponema sp. C6A8 TaxID=1410609 RepID=UPI000480EA12|nr:hypothetical protein [Treponema sp. C6A8]
MDYNKLRFDSSSFSLDVIRSRFEKFIIYESDSNNWKKQWLIMNSTTLKNLLSYSAKEVYEELFEELNGANFEGETLYSVRIIDSKTLNTIEEYRVPKTSGIIFKNTIIKSLFETFLDMDEKLNALFFPFLLVPVNGPLLTNNESNSINENYKSFKTIAKRFIALITEIYKQNFFTLDKNVLHKIKEKSRFAAETYSLSKIDTLNKIEAKKVTVAFRLYNMLIGKFMTAILANSKPKQEN